MGHPPALGRNIPRREGLEKITGRAIYVDDLPREGVWYGGTVRACEPHARLRGICFDPAFPWHEVVVVTAEDIPGRNAVALILEDQPALAERRIRHAGEAVLLVAAPERELLEKALAAVRLDTEPLPALLSPQQALAAAGAGGPVLHAPDNVFKRIEIAKGRASEALGEAEHVVEGEYVLGSQEHVYVEPQGVQAEWTAEGVTVAGSLQCPYYVARGIAGLLDLPQERVRVVQKATGGGFGGKEEYPSMIAAHAALLSRKAGRPVRIVYERGEDMLATTKRHPARVRHRTGLSRAGRITAMEIDILLDGGAYCTLSPVVLSRAAIHAAGPYDIENVLVRARAVATNNPPFGAFRGFGAPQALFALEVHLDECAQQLGLDPVALRRHNLLRRGGTLATGQDLGEDVSVEEVLERALETSRFQARRAEFEQFNAQAPSRRDEERFRRRGIGLSLFHHGAGFTGSGEVILASVAGLRGNSDGTVTVLSSQTEMGQGTRTILAQAAAEGLGIEVGHVITEDPDTARMPDSGPTVASRTAMVVGGLLVRAGRRMREEVERAAGRELADSAELRREIGRLAAERPLEVRVRYEPPEGVRWDEENYRGDAYATYSWACHVAAVEVEMLTGEVRVMDFTAVQEVGRVLNPVLAAGQVEGGVVQGIGWALLERVVWEKGVMANATLSDYAIPTASDAPPIRVVFLEHPHPRAPHGAKGIGELPMDGPAPAIVNALRHALGVRLNRVPVTPERILEALDEAGE